MALLLTVLLALAFSAPVSAQVDVFGTAANSDPRALWPATARFAPLPSPRTPLPAVCRVISPERDGASLGSGTLVDVSDKHGLVITNWHVVKDAAGNVIVSFPDGFQSPGYVIKMDRDWDLAAVAIWRPNVAPMHITADAPRPGEMLTIAGYGAGNYLAQSGRCTQYLSPGNGFPFEIVGLAATARHGDSGGPILNSRGEIAGVLFGEGGGETSGSYGGRVKMFLTSIGGGATPPARAPGVSPAVIAAAPAVDDVRQLVPVPGSYTARPPAAAPPADEVAYSPVDPMMGKSGSAARSSYSQPPPPPKPAADAPLAALAAPSQPGGATALAVHDADARPTVEHVGWEEIAGRTGGEQLKTVLAGLGILLLLWQVIRLVA